MINDSPYARADVQSSYVRWAPPTPSGIADQLIEILDSPPDPARVAGSARREAWRPGQAAFVRGVEDETYGVSPTPGSDYENVLSRALATA